MATSMTQTLMRASLESAALPARLAKASAEQTGSHSLLFAPVLLGNRGWIKPGDKLKNCPAGECRRDATGRLSFPGYEL